MARLACGCYDYGRHVFDCSDCAEADRLWAAHMAVPNDAEHRDQQRATLVAYWRHREPNATDADLEQSAREMLR